MKIILDKGAYMPERAHKDDAGLDIRTPYAFTLAGCDPSYGAGKAIIHTGIHIQTPNGYSAFLKSKSGLNTKHDIIGEGVIDVGYNGEILVKLYNLGPHEHHFDRGDKIIQIVIVKIAEPEELEQVAEFEETERGESGFGSTGR